MPWLLELLQSFETKPVFAGGFATALCALLLFGAVMAQRPESVAQAILQPASQEAAPLIASATPTTIASQPVNQMLIADNSTNPVVNFKALLRFGWANAGQRTVHILPGHRAINFCGQAWSSSRSLS